MPKRRTRVSLYCLTLLGITIAAGCAGAHRSNPIIDPAGVDMGRYQSDLAECEQIAKQVEQKAGAGAVGGAIVGGLVGAVVGNSDTVAQSAAVGGILGGAKGAGDTHQEKGLVVKNCLRNRGYTVLN